MQMIVKQISQESIDILKMIYPDLSVNKAIKQLLIDRNTLEKQLNTLKNEKMVQRDALIKQIKLNTDKILEYCIKHNLTNKSSDLVVSKELIEPLYNTIDDVILDQDTIDEVTKYYRDQGGNMIDKNIHESLQRTKEKIFKNQQLV